MGKREELRLLRNSTSADAPINYHHRTGDSEGNGGSMLDLYTQVQSVEEDILEEEDKAAQGVFIRAFKLFLRQTLTGRERKFLNAVMSGKGKPHEIGRAMKINWFDCMQEIRRKAFANAETFKRVATLSGWSRAELFSEAIFKRLRNIGGELITEESREKKRIRARAMLAGFGATARKERTTDMKYYMRMYMRNLRKQLKKAGTPYHKRESEIRYQKSERGKAIHREANRRWSARNVEKMKAYREKNKEHQKEYQKEYQKRNKEKRKAYREKNKEYQKEYQKKNKEKMKAYQAEYRAKKRAEKKAAQLLAGLMEISQREPEGGKN